MVLAIPYGFLRAEFGENSGGHPDSAPGRCLFIIGARVPPMLDSLDTLIAFVLIMLLVSMLITIAVQLLATAFNLRGKYLGKGLAHTFKTILPKMDGDAETLACRILSGRLLSDSPMRKLGRCATAVRPDEVFDALHRVATGRVTATAELRKNARSVLRGLGISEAFLAQADAETAALTGAVGGTAQDLKATAAALVAQLPSDQQAKIQEAFRKMAERIRAYEATAAQVVGRDAQAVAKALDDAYRKFHYWFDVSQERAQQWFTSHTRWFTVGLAVLFAFWLQLDTVEIFKLVSSNRALREKIVAQAEAVTRQANRVLVDRESVAQQAVIAWRNSLSDEAAKNAVANVTPARTDTPETVRSDLRNKLAEANIQNADALLASFDSTVASTAEQNAKDLKKDFQDVGHLIDDSGFSLFPPHGKGRWGDHWSDNLGKHFWGMIFSVGLLSLGAPFWFNALKSLANLRSRVAENITTEQKGEKPPPGTGASKAPGEPPATVVSTT
jgi:hypothetical protein